MNRLTSLPRTTPAAPWPGLLAWLWLFAPVLWMWPSGRSLMEVVLSGLLFLFVLRWRGSTRVAVAVLLLAEGQIAGATLDVFRQEPLPAGHPFWAEPRITLTPHTSARTLRDESIAQIVGKVVALSRGEPVKGMVDPQRGY